MMYLCRILVLLEFDPSDSFSHLVQLFRLNHTVFGPPCIKVPIHGHPRRAFNGRVWSHARQEFGIPFNTILKAFKYLNEPAVPDSAQSPSVAAAEPSKMSKQDYNVILDVEDPNIGAGPSVRM